MSELDFFPAHDAAHLRSSPVVYCWEGVRYEHEGNTLIVHRGDQVHRGHPAVLAEPWKFGSEQPLDLSSAPTDELDRADADLEDERRVDEQDDAIPFPEPELDVPDDDQAPDPPGEIPYGAIPEPWELEPVEGEVEAFPQLDDDVDPTHPDA